MLSDIVPHYGSAAAEIAVCSKAVGLAERSDLLLLDVSGAPTLLEHALAPAISDAVRGRGGGAWPTVVCGSSRSRRGSRSPGAVDRGVTW